MNLSTRTSVFCLILTLYLIVPSSASAQSTDSTRSSKYFGGSVAATNNGISLLPTFSLNKPAALVTMAAGKRLTFEPEFRFSLEGKPWSFIFWGRYQVIQGKKFRMSVGAHPGYLFRTSSVIANGNTNNTISAERYLAAELSPNYFITKNTSVGLYYLQSKGFSESSVKATHFLTLNANVSKITLYQSYFLKFNPQIYYLKMDDKDGYYVTSTITLAKSDFPWSLQTIMNQTIESEIASPDFIWNISLIYSFGNWYKPM